MVKGLSRKIIVVKSPDPKIFDQAIFIVRDDYLMNRSIDQKELMRQANEAASGYVIGTYHKQKNTFIKPLICGCLGLLIIGIIVAAKVLV